MDRWFGRKTEAYYAHGDGLYPITRSNLIFQQSDGSYTMIISPHATSTRKSGVSLTLVFLLAFCSLTMNALSQIAPASNSSYRLVLPEKDKMLSEELTRYIDKGLFTIEEFFQLPFQKSFEVYVQTSRKGLDAFFQQRWKVEKTECWMVAAGVADFMVVLSPRAWQEQACDHNPDELQHVQDIITHELIHVLHAQQNPSKEFEGMDSLSWFVEGLATYASGQIEHAHQTDAREAVESGQAPTQLSTAWSGRYRYGVCGSLVEYIYKRYGKEILKSLMPVTEQFKALGILGVSEEEFLSKWKNYVMNNEIN